MHSLFKAIYVYNHYLQLILLPFSHACMRFSPFQRTTQGGASPSDLSRPDCVFKFQQFVLRSQLHLEDSMEAYARSTGQPAVLICDRGIMDGAAYCPAEEFKRLLEIEGLDISARDSRYNAVIHLVTAADGAATHYNLASNLARHESVAEVRYIPYPSRPPVQLSCPTSPWILCSFILIQNPKSKIQN